MPTIRAASGAGNANSYVTLELADDYFAQGLQASAWNAQEESDREAALIGATRAIERLRLGGTPDDTSTPQALHFPRADDTDRTIVDEEFTSEHDSAVQLLRSGITTDSVTVEDSSGTAYTEDTDYTIDYDNGTITVASTGSMSDDTTYYISYDHGIPQAVEEATCEQAIWLLRAAEGGGDDLPVDHRELQGAGVSSFSLDGISVSYERGTGELCEVAMGLLRGYTTRTGHIMPRGT